MHFFKYEVSLKKAVRFKRFCLALARLILDGMRELMSWYLWVQVTLKQADTDWLGVKGTDW